MRFFVREDGRLHPTILFWLFLVPVLTIIVAGCYAVLDRRAEQATAEAALTRTPTAAVTETQVLEETRTPEPPMPEPTATEFVYDDPIDWEFVEKTDPTGKKYLDLQDWQKDQVWHAFEKFWNLRYRAENGMTPYEQLEPLVTGRMLEALKFDYQYAEEHDEYVYLLQPLSEINRAMTLKSAGTGVVSVEVFLASDFGFPLEVRHPETGGILEMDQRFPFKTWSFILTFQDDHWVVEDAFGTELE